MFVGKLRKLYKDIIGKPLCLWKKRDFSSDIQEIDSLDIELVGHCDLNCRSCNHYSPIAEKSEILLEEIEEELKQLQILFGEGEIRKINLLGGEPLLHSNISACMCCVRKFFPDSMITIITNGVKLLVQNELFWETAREKNIKIVVTKYPINLDYEEVKRQAEKQGVELSFFGRTKYVQKTQYHLPLDLEGNQNGKYSFENCFMARNCTTLQEGKIYPCPVAAFIGRFNNYFGENIPVLEADYGDIWKESREEILKKLSHPIPLCQYCNVKNRTYGNKWRRSNKSIEEWT